MQRNRIFSDFCTTVVVLQVLPDSEKVSLPEESAAHTHNRAAASLREHLASRDIDGNVV